MKLDQHVCLDEISHKFENSVMSSQKLGHNLEKPCAHSRGHIFSLIIMKLGQNDFLDGIWDKFESVSCQVKN